jgi:tetratricopeptide (TPR) repeat protein
MRYPTFIARPLVPCLLLVVLAAAVYWPVYRFDFVDYDDNQYVFQNPNVQAGFSAQTVRVAFTTFQMGNWNPLLWVSFYVDHALFNLRAGPMHVENVVMHLCSGLLLWHLLIASTGRRLEAFVVAALFICHPMHVESVAWISERKDVLSTVWLFAAMAAYVHYCKQSPGRRVWIAYLLVVACFGLSLLSKAMGMTFPALLLLLDFWPLQRWPARSWAALVVEKLPLFALAAASAVIAATAQVYIRATATVAQVGLLSRIGNALTSYVLYLFKLIVPLRLAVIYPLAGDQSPAAVIAAALLLTCATIAAYRLRRSKPYLLVGWLWFCGTLLPVSGLVQIGATAMADRYSYIPYVGLFVAVAWLAGDLLSKPAFAAGAAAALTALTWLAHVQAMYWQNSQTLFTHTLEVTEHNPIAHIDLGMDALVRNDLRTAIDQCNLALRDGPNPDAYEGLGTCWMRIDPREAISYFRLALLLNPDNARYHMNLAIALDGAGQLGPAEQEASQAVALQPDYAPAIFELEHLLSEKH